MVPARSFYGRSALVRLDSEEFLTLLIHAIDGLQVAHEHEKVKMLGAAPANSCRTERASDHRKEIFVQAIRDLTPLQVQVLRELQRGATVEGDYFRTTREMRNANSERLMLLQKLSSLGLVVERLELKRIRAPGNFSSQGEAVAWLKKYLERVPETCFSLSRFGYDFLIFVSESSESQPAVAPATGS